MLKEILVKMLMAECERKTAKDIRLIEKEMKRNPDSVMDNLSTYEDLQEIKGSGLHVEYGGVTIK